MNIEKLKNDFKIYALDNHNHLIDNEIKLSRKQLLKHYGSIKFNYEYNYTNSFEYLFKVEDYADVR